MNGRLRCGGDGGAVGGVQCDQMVLLFVKIGTGLQNKNNVTDFIQMATNYKVSMWPFKSMKMGPIAQFFAKYKIHAAKILKI